MSIRERVLAPCGARNIFTKRLYVDFDVVLRNLLLFDTYIVDSFGLEEIPGFLQMFGYEGLLQLVESGALRFRPFRLFAGHMHRAGTGLELDQTRFSLVLDGTEAPERPGFFEVTNAYIGDPAEEFERYLRIVDGLPGLSPDERTRLAGALEGCLVDVPPNTGTESTQLTHRELDRDPAALRRAIARLLSKVSHTDVTPASVDLNVHREGEIAVLIESNLPSTFGLDPNDAHTLIGNGLLAVDRLNVRIELMKLCGAISGANGEDFAFIEDKLDFLAREVDPDVQAERFQRVLEIVGLPDLAGAFSNDLIDMETFLDVRASKECAEFKAWLRSVDDFDDEELLERIQNLRGRLGNAANATGGKLVRMVATNGIGFVPVVGPILGFAASALDEFLLGQLLPEAGPVGFVGNLYPSIFRKPPEDMAR
jgi:hypothetical protein